MHRNLICVKKGDLYGPEYVINLYEGVKRYQQKKFLFHVFTDDDKHLPKRPDWIIHKLPDWKLTVNKFWFYKICMFNKDNGIVGRNLYIDLDCIIAGDLTEMWAYNNPKFVICRDFNRVYIPKFTGVNSSVMSWSDGDMDSLYRNFMSQKQEMIGKHRGDQDFIQDSVHDRNFWPDEWVRSYKWEVWRGGIKNARINDYVLEEHRSIIPNNCRIIAFHGRPKPHEITEPHLRKLWSGN